MSQKIPRWMHFNLRYLGQPPWDTGVSPPELINFLKETAPGKALDVGCGTGTNLLTMASFGWKVVGVDMAWLSVIKARAKLRKAGLPGRVMAGNVAGRLLSGEVFDLVLDIGCYHSLGSGERSAYRKNLACWMRHGGAYLLYAHFQTSPTDPHGIAEADFAEFSDLLDLQWRENQAEHRPDGGGGRPATWAHFTRRE